MPPSRSRPICVVVVDDFPDGRDLLDEYLTFRGFTVHVAGDGAEAIEIVRQVRPDIVLMDLSMAGVDGWEAARILKSDRKTRAIPVIAVTAHAMNREVAAARTAGCDGVITKPFDLAALADALPRVLSLGASALDVPGLALNPPEGAKTPRRSSSRPKPTS